MPRLGKIHLGIKKVAQSGKEYPSATDYFVLPEELTEQFGEKPVELPIMFPVEDADQFTSQFYRAYSLTRGLTCKGDGITCHRLVDTKTGDMANRNTKEAEWKEAMECKGRQCPDYGRRCKEVMNLQFLLPTVPGLGIWQIDTGSINSIININSGIELIRAVYGRIAMLPLTLALEPCEVVNPDDHKKKTVRVLNLRTKGTMMELMEAAVKPVREMLLPAPAEEDEPLDLPVPDDEVPELIIPQTQEPKDETGKGKSGKAKAGVVEPPTELTPEQRAQADEDIKVMYPEEVEEALAETIDSQDPEKEVQEVAPGGTGEETGQTEGSGEKPVSPIDTDWLREQLAILEGKLEGWSKKNVLSYIKVSYRRTCPPTSRSAIKSQPRMFSRQSARWTRDRLLTLRSTYRMRLN
jgi:hypothetical protein